MLSWLLVSLFGEKGPGKVKKFTAEVDEMANVRLAWQLPSVSPRQRPLEHTTIDARVSASLPWTPISNVPADLPPELLIEDSAPGNWFFRSRVMDDQGTYGPEAFTQITVGFDAPGAVTEFTATLE